MRIGNGIWDCRLRSATNFCRSGMMATILGAGRQCLVRLHQCIDVDAAIGAPVPAMEDHSNGSPTIHCGIKFRIAGALGGRSIAEKYRNGGMLAPEHGLCTPR